MTSGTPWRETKLKVAGAGPAVALWQKGLLSELTNLKYYFLWTDWQADKAVCILLAIQLQGTRMEIRMLIEMLCKCKLGLFEVLQAKTMIHAKSRPPYEKIQRNWFRILDLLCNLWSTARLGYLVTITSISANPASETSSWNWTYQIHKWLFDCTHTIW